MTRVLLPLAVVLVLGGGGAAWWMASAADPVTTDQIGDSVQTRDRGQLPTFIQGEDARALYRFAAEHPEVLQFMPCVCGCVDFGHTSNRACYIKAETAQRVTWTSHAAT